MSKKLTELKFHGGQSWANMKNYVEDFSVTTNCMGTPESGLNAIRETLQHIDHYPPSSNEPALSNLCKFVWREENMAKANKVSVKLLFFWNEKYIHTHTKKKRKYFVLKHRN